MARVSDGMPASSLSTPAATAEGATPRTGIPACCHAWAGGAEGAGLPRSGRADQDGDSFAAGHDLSDGLGLVGAEVGFGERRVGGGDGNAGGPSGLDDVEHGLFGL